MGDVRCPENVQREVAYVKQIHQSIELNGQIGRPDTHIANAPRCQVRQRSCYILIPALYFLLSRFLIPAVSSVEVSQLVFIYFQERIDAVINYVN